MQSRAANIAAWVIFALAALKIIATVSSSPLIAYANNWDFARESACYGVWEKYPNGKDKTTFNFEGPVNPLIYDGDTRPEWCARVIDNVFIRSVLAFHKVGDAIDLREIGLLRAAFLIVMTFWLMRMLKEHRLFASIAFALVFGDLAYLSFFNTLYAEFSMLSGALLSVFAGVLLLHEDRPSWRAVLFAIISLAFFGGAKEQYLPLAILAGLLMAIILAIKWGSRLSASALAVAALALPATLLSVNSHSTGVMATIKVANIMDAVMLGVLPNASNPINAMHVLKLPDHCAKAIGVSWYDPGVANNLPCPEVASVSRVSFLRLFASDPQSFGKPMWLALQKTRPLQLHYLPNAENEGVRDSATYIFVKETSLSTWFDRLPHGAYAMVACVMFVFGSIYAVMRRDRVYALPIAVASVLAFYAIFSSVFGDGFMELAKHATAFTMGLLLYVSAAIYAAIVETRNRRNPPSIT
jgi:hypothetical protein